MYCVTVCKRSHQEERSPAVMSVFIKYCSYLVVEEEEKILQHWYLLSQISFDHRGEGATWVSTFLNYPATTSRQSLPWFIVRWYIWNKEATCSHVTTITMWRGDAYPETVENSNGKFLFCFQLSISLSTFWHSYPRIMKWTLFCTQAEARFVCFCKWRSGCQSSVLLFQML